MIENHVVNFELSKRLHELGVRKESIFVWSFSIKHKGFRNGKYVAHPSFPDMIVMFRSDIHLERKPVYPAYTASELLEIIDKRNWIKKEERNFLIYPIIEVTDENNWEGYKVYHPKRFCFWDERNICNALAKMLIYLIENMLVDVEEINK